MKKLLLTLLSVISLVAYADDEIPTYSVFGYVSQSVVKGNGVNVGGSVDGKTSWDKREITVFGDWRPKNVDIEVRGAIGTIDEPGLRYDSPTLYVKYLLADKRWRVSNTDVIGLRVGRVPHFFGFFNLTRNAPHTLTYVFLPEGLPGYYEGFKHIAMSGDGVQAYLNHQFNDYSAIEVTGSYTRASMIHNQDVVSAHISNPRLGRFDEKHSHLTGFAISGYYKTLNFYYNYINMNYLFKPNIPIPTGYLDTDVHVMGVKKFINNFEFGVEYLTVRLQSKTWSYFVPDPKGSPVGWIYLSTWHATPKLDVSVYHSEYYTQEHDKSGERQAAMIAKLGDPKPASWFYSKANSISAKYTLNESWLAKIQYTRGHGLNAFSKLQNKQEGKDWSYIAAQLVYRF